MTRVSPRPSHSSPQWEVASDPKGERRLRLAGPLTSATVGPLWPLADELFLPRRPTSEPTPSAPPPTRLRVDATEVQQLDGAGLALLVRLRCLAATAGCALELEGLRDGYQRLLDRFDPKQFHDVQAVAPRPRCFPEQVGETTAQIWRDFQEQVGFVGELTAALARALVRPRSLRWRDLWLSAERAGADALPIVVLISGLVGLVLAFQSAMAMRPYGAEIYVANLVTIAMLRELGPLMTAIILAGRSGGAFAAEIGTMQVNDEVAALTTLGLRPVPFLAVPRVLGLLLMIPFLTLFANLVGVAGGAVVFLSFDYPISTYFDQALSSAEPRHLFSGLIKSLAFGLTVAGVGCLRGLQTLRGPSAVGASTTRAVVTGILLIVILDAILGTVFYLLEF